MSKLGKRLFSILTGTILLILAFYFFYFLRDPQRNIPNDPSLFVAPANGKIIAIIQNPTQDDILYKNNTKVLDNFVAGIGSGATMISIMMTPLNVHYQKAPLDAKLIDQIYVPGKKLNAMKNATMLESTLQNEYNAMLFETPQGIRFKVIQIAWFVARRIVPYLDINQEVQQGDHIGLIKFWSQVTVIFDKNIDITAKLGDIVIDGETVLWKVKIMTK
jgi:phosphatidylserine decarboxylase